MDLVSLLYEVYRANLRLMQNVLHANELQKLR